MTRANLTNVDILKAAITASCVVAATMLAGAAQAGPVTGQVGLATQYLGKGIGKSNDEASVSGQIEVNHNGFYASLFGATAELSQGADAEILTTVGYRRTVSGYAFDLSVINRDLPGTRKGVDANYTEYQVDASHKFGPVSTRLRVNYTRDGFAATQEAWWVEAQGGVALDSHTKATAAIANRTADGGAEYVAWNVGVKRKLNDRISADLRWYDTDGHDYGDAYEGRLVAALTYSF